MHTDSIWLRKVLGSSFEIGVWTGILVVALIFVIAGYVTGRWGPVKKAIEEGERERSSSVPETTERSSSAPVDD